MASPRHPAVFISYAGPFHDAANIVRRFLQSAFSLGQDAVFLAPTSIGASGGEHDNFVAAITKNALDADAFIILATRDYAHRFWCRYEALLRSSGLKTNQRRRSVSLQNHRHWFPIWIDRHATLATEFGKDEYLRLTGLPAAQGYRAWVAEDMTAFLHSVGSVIAPESTINWSAFGSQLASEMELLVTKQDIPGMVFARLLDSLRESIRGAPIPAVFQDNYVVDGAMTLSICRAEGGKITGLPLSKVAIVIENEPFALPQDLEAEYHSFFREKAHDPGRYWDEHGKGDGDKLMLSKLPLIMSDHIDAGGKIYLYVRPVKYSQGLFFQERFLKDAGVIAKNLKDLADEHRAPFPSILCLHMVIITQDERVVVVRRAPTLHYYPGKYAATIEEQLHPKKDFEAVGADRIMSVEAWVRRALEEEFSLSDHHFAPEDARILSVFLEHTIMNLSLCALVRIKLDASSLRAHLASNLRSDYEFDRTLFFSSDEALSEVVSPSLAHHPTSRYRMLMALFNAHGVDWIKARYKEIEMGLLHEFTS